MKCSATWGLLLLALLATSAAAQTTVTENFDAHTMNARVPGWTDSTLGSGIETDRFRIYADSQNPDNQVYGMRHASGELITPTPGIGTMSTLMNPVFPARGRLELRGRMMRTSDESRIGVAFLSGYPESGRAYLLALWSSTGPQRPTVRLFAHGGGEVAGVTDSRQTLGTGRWYHFYILSESTDRGTFIRARVWPDGEREPETFSINAVDASSLRPASGRIGLWASRVSRTRGVQTTNRPDTMFDDLEISSDPDAVIEEPVDAIPPAITLLESGASLIDGTTFTRDVAIEIRISDQSPFTSTALLNGNPYVSGTPVTANGSWTLTVTAVDSFGNRSEETVQFTIDKSVPSESSITVTSHQEGSRLAIRSQTVSGTARNVSQIQVNGVAATLESSGAFTAQIELAEGASVIEVSAMTPAGERLQRRINVVVDSLAPSLTVTTPATGSCLSAAAVELAGTAADPHLMGVTVTLDGVATPTVISGTQWRATVSAAEGSKQFVVRASDSFGHQTSAVHTLTIDRTPPEIAISESGLPFTATVVNRGVFLLIRATDGGSAIDATATLNGAPFVSGRTIDDEGNWELRVVATDCAGHRAEKTVAFTIDRSPPAFRDLVPAPGSSVREKPVSIRGTTDADVATVRAVGSPASSTPVEGRFSLDGITIREGTNNFLLEATDRAGNATQLDYSFRLNSTAPGVEILDRDAPIPANALFNRPVSPVVRSSDPAASTTARMNGASFTSGTTLSVDGSYAIEATATDALGNSGVADASFVIDRTPPVVTITAPLSGAADSGFVEVRGTATDAVTVRVNGAIVAVQGDSTFVLTGLALEPGDNLIIATATDRAGNTARDEVVVTREFDSPGIIITFPPDLFSTNRSTVAVQGRVLSGGAGQTVRIGVLDLLTDAAGGFRIDSYALSEGENSIQATTGSGTNSRTASVRVRVDTTPPLLEILESGQPLEEGSRFAEGATLSLRVEDAGSVTSSLTVDGVAVATFPFEITAAGGHIAEAFARDAAGNESRAERAFFIGESAITGPCVLSDIDPVDGSVIFGTATTIAGRAAGATAVTVNGSPASTADGSFAARIELPAEGENRITIACTGADGASGEPVTLTLRRLTGDPSVTITAPEESSATANAQITVTVTVSPDVTSVRVSGVTAALANGTFTANGVRLSDGVNIVVAEARNDANRIARASRRITHLASTPSLIITAPAGASVILSEAKDPLTTGGNSIDISGTFAHLDPASITVTNLASPSAVTIDARKHSDTKGTFRARNVPLIEGPQTIRATGIDRLGRSTETTISVTRTTGLPSIRIASPLDNSLVGTAATEIAISGTFAAAPGSTIEVNGEPAAVTGDQFSSSATIPSQAGPFPIIARVTQPDGSSTTSIALVTRLRERPRVVEVFPSSGASAADPGAVIRILFSVPMDATPFTAGAFTLTEDSGSAITGLLDVSGAVLSFAPSALLSSGRIYTIRVTPSAADLAGNTLESEFVSTFTVAAGAPAAPPVLNPIVQAGCDSSITVTGTAPPFARLRLELGTLSLETTAASDGRFTFTVPLSGDPFYRVVRVRILGADDSLSATAEADFRADCSSPRVVSALFSRTVNLLTITFSKPIDPASLTSASLIVELPGGTAATGTIASIDPSTFRFTPTSDLKESSFTLRITTAVRDLGGNPLATPFSRFFPFAGTTPPPASGSGFVSGEVFDATTGRPLPGAEVQIEVPVSGLSKQEAEAQADKVEVTAFSTITDARGRYATPLPEGAHIIRVTAPNHTTAWRQIIIPAGAGIVPIDIRLTERGQRQIATGAAMTLNHGGETTVTRRATLNIPAGTLSSGAITLTSIGAQSLPGLLPLGWSPLATAEIHSPLPAGEGSGVRELPGTTLTFDLPAEQITNAAQTLTAAQYDEQRDEWRVLTAVVNIADNTATINIATTGIYTLVYPDKAPALNRPERAITGAVLQPVADRCPCDNLVAESFILDPPLILPTGRTVATLTIEGTTDFPSGTPVQAYIDEELHLADGSRLVEAPFSTDLLLYRTLTGDKAIADFHLAPSPRAAEVVLEVGYEHIRVLPYPGRLDRGTLLGPEGGRIPSDSGVIVEVPTGATDEVLRASASSLSTEQLQSIVPIAGYKILAGFTLDLTRASETQETDLQAAAILNKPARATFTIDSVALPTPTSQLILVEILPQTARLAALSSPLPAGEGSGVRDLRVSTQEIDRTVLPLDGITREGRYLLLAAENPIAFTTGALRSSATGPYIPNATISTPALGVADITRLTGIFALPVPAQPAPPFTLVPRHPSRGAGTPHTHPAAPTPGAIVNLGDLIHTPQPLFLVNTSPANGATEVSLASNIRATFSSTIDPASIGCTPGTTTCALVLTETLTGQRVVGTIAIESGITLAFTPTERLRPNSRYAVTIASSIEGTNGARLARTETFTFSTITQLLDPTIDAARIHITIPDANGRSRIYGDPAAITSGWQAVAVRRGVDFTTRPQATAAANGSFSFTAETVTINDLIDLHVINNAGNVAAIVPLTPFASEDRRTFVARGSTATKFTSADGITIHVPAGAFSELTHITIAPESRAAFDGVPRFDDELSHITSVRIEFAGVARARIQIDLPAPSGIDTTKQYLLGLLGNSFRGPRVMIVDTLRIADGNFTTTEEGLTKLSSPLPAGAPPNNGSGVRASSAQFESVNAVLTGSEVKRHLLGLNRSGVFLVTNIIVPVPSGFVAMEALQAGFDIFWDHFASLFAADFYLTESRGRIVIPVLAGLPLLIEGVDSGSGFKLFEKRYDAIPLGDPGTAVIIEDPNPDLTGPYPIFATPVRVESVVLNNDTMAIRNFELTRSGSLVSIKASDLAEGVKVQALNTRTGASTPPASVSAAGTATLILPAERADRILLLVGVVDVSPATGMSIVFNEPIQIPGSTDEEIVASLRSLVQLRARTTTGEFDVTNQVAWNIDSGGRRIHLALPGGNLVRGARYEIVLKSDIRDISGNKLGQGVSGGIASGGETDLTLQFSVRAPHGRIGDFALEPSPAHPGASLRDMARYGNILFISALEGGLLAYDISDPGGLQTDASGAEPRPFAFVPGSWEDSTGTSISAGFDEHWAVATDRHGRVYSTGFTSIFGAIRSYRVEDFIAAKDSPDCSGPTPLTGSLCRFHGAAIVSWRPGVSSSISLATGTILSDRPEATPRKLQIVLQDDETSYASIDELKAAVPHTLLETSRGYERLDARFTYNPDTTTPYYLTQRITVENLTLRKRWSAGVRAHGPGAWIRGIEAGPRDRLRVYRNLRTWGVISQFGFGVSVIDLNAVESNDAPDKPSGYVAPREQVITTRADAESSCAPFDPLTGGIRDLAFSPEAAAVPNSDPSTLLAFATEVRKGVLGIGVPLEATGTPRDCIERQALGFLLYDTALDYIHPRLESIEEAHSDAGAFFSPRFGSIAHYRGDLLGTPQDYVLMSGGSLGLLAVSVNNPTGSTVTSPYLDEASLAGVVWIPSGVYAVRTIPETHLATVVDGRGRVLLVDLSRIDERFSEAGVPLPAGQLFPTALAALTNPAATPGEIGVDDPRVVWASEPGLVTGTIPPILHPGTGMLFSGETLGREMHVSSVLDAILRVLLNLGAGSEETGSIVPLGMAPPAGLITGADPDASSAAFRIEVELPAGLAKALEESGRRFYVSVETERISGVASAQTPPGNPKAHLRRKDRDGNPEPADRSTAIELRRVSPFGTDDWHQEGSNLYRSDWIVAVADERASVHYAWPAGSDKSASGCFNCERPAHLAGRTEADGVYELWTDGRFITVRPEAGIFDGTSYEYLEEAGRLETRVTTFQARKTRDAQVLVAGHNPPIAEGMLQETHYIHSNELETAALDMNSGGRAGVEVVMTRNYRSRTLGGTPLGEGWDAAIFRTLIVHPNGDVEYHDGTGEIWLFARDTSTGSYISPRGLFLKLIRTQSGWSMIDQQWRIATFDDLGRLVSESDEFYDPAKPGSGNTIHYVYDATGRLSTILDPLDRATVLEYWSATDAKAPCALPGPAADEPCGFAGRLKEVRTAWRNKSVAYQYDRFGRLTAVNLPEASNSRVPELSHTGDKRPTIRYSYLPVPAPSPGEPAASAAYTEFALRAGNLTGIKDPEQTALGLAGKERVTFGWEGDRNVSQTWGTGETATFGVGENTDVLGQRRTYTLTPEESFDRRRHFATKQVHDVPVMSFGEAGLPDAISVSAAPAMRTLETIYQYNEHGLETTLTLPSGLTVTNDWVPASGGAAGMVLAGVIETGGGVYRETSQAFDPAANAANNPFRTGRRDRSDKSFTFRDQQQPGRSRSTIETNDTGITSSATFDSLGQLTAITTSEDGEPGMETRVEYYAASAANPQEAGRPKRVWRGGGEISFSSTYVLAENGEETESTKDDIRGVKTTVVKDADGRMIGRTVAESSGGLLAEERFGYDASGRLVYQSRKQTGAGEVVTRFAYDAAGRQVHSEMSGARVLDSASGEEVQATLETRTLYDLPARRITSFDPFRDSESAAPRTMTRLDGLGRATETHRQSADGVSRMRGISLYDIHGQAAYESDLTREASLTRHDALGRPVAMLRSDGVRIESAYNEWDEVTGTSGFERRGADAAKLMMKSRSLYTPHGRERLMLEQIDEDGRAVGTGFTWRQGDRVMSSRVGETAIGEDGFADTVPVRVVQSVRDAAGRTLSEVIGAALGPLALPAIADTYAENRVVEYLGEAPQRRELHEPRAGRKSESLTQFDGLGRPVAMIEAGVYASTFAYDEAGNVLTSQAPGLETARTSYDSRGLPLIERQPTGTEIRRIYDELGNLRRYIDEAGEVTHYDTDSIGRTFRIRYPDGTREEVRFEEGTGALLATRDRAGQWFWFEYDSAAQRVVAEHLGGTGAEPSLTANPFTRYVYDNAARLTRIVQADAAIEYAQFDLIGRPRITRTIRFTKAPCPPAILPCGTGLTSGEIAEIYTQGHEWSVFENERERWRMPAAGASLPLTETASSWRKWIVETRDGAGNLIAQKEAPSATASPEGPTLSESVARGMGRLAERRRGPLTSRFGYADAPAGGSTFVVPVIPAAPGPAIGSLGRAETLRGSVRLAGSEILLDAKKLIGDSADLGLTSRASQWNYDGRARLESSELLRDLASPIGVPSVEETLLAADFRKAREITPPRLGEVEYEALGLMAKSVVPLTWIADAPATANQLTKRTFTHGAISEGEENFAFAGGRRTNQGTSSFSYDPRGRLIAHEMLAAGRRIHYAYDPNDRMIGRTSYRLTDAGTWILEDRTNVLARDGLPADSTFVWDPIVDRLVAIYQANVPQISSESGLLRQYLHGDQGYDDPLDVLIASVAGEPAKQYFPIIDHAGTGSLQAVADAEGHLVERALYADSYGDAPRYLHGAVVERVTITPEGSGRTIRVELSETFDPATLASGATLSAVANDNTILRIAGNPAPSALESERAFEWKLSGAEWSAFTAGAASVQISITTSLRFPAWGKRPLQEASEWQQTLGRAGAAPGTPFIKRLTVDETGAVYEVSDLYLVASTESKTKLHLDFHSLPFRDPANGLSYARARWLDNATGQFVTPDPMGYADSSNLYAFCAGDPINCSDPTGELGWKDIQRTGASLAGFVVGAVESGVTTVAQVAAMPVTLVGEAAIDSYTDAVIAISAYQTGGLQAVRREAEISGRQRRADSKESLLSMVPLRNTIRNAGQIVEAYGQGDFEGGRQVGRTTFSLAMDATAVYGTVRAVQAISPTVGVNPSVPVTVLRGSRNPRVAEALRKGQIAHKQRTYPPGFEKEVTLPSRARMDAYNAELRQVRELKPENPRAIKKGEKRLKEYCAECDEVFGPGHTGIVETYNPSDIPLP